MAFLILLAYIIIAGRFFYILCPSDKLKSIFVIKGLLLGPLFGFLTVGFTLAWYDTYASLDVVVYSTLGYIILSSSLNLLEKYLYR